MQLTQKIREHRNTHKTLRGKNDVRRPVKILTLISRGLDLGLEAQVIVNVTD